MRLAAELHDVGKVAVPDSILSKPAPLDDEEWEFIRRHTLIGERIIAAAPALRPSRARALQPRALGRHRLPRRGLPARRSRSARGSSPSADAFDAMTSDAAVQRGRAPASDALELRRCAGAQFDPVVVEAFCAAWADHRVAVAA